ncbi:MAG: hypothetical protein J2P36_21700, partial [Ktedonobacteraceae bacterium]|nr:hypothetical protein [Ktedonobacteraceae bacterium]
MQRKNTLWSIALVDTLLAIVLTACGAGAPAPTANNSPTTPNQERLYVLEKHPGPDPRIIAFHPGDSAPVMTFTSGLFSLDHQRLYVATPRTEDTSIKVQDTRTGSIIRQFTISGAYSTNDQAYTKAVLSGDGQWLVMRATGQVSQQTSIVVVDTLAGKVSRSIRLKGNFDVDAISPDGSYLYLLERFNPANGDYHVRLYSILENKLVDGTIADKTEPDENMTGTALTRQMPVNGQIAFTLYTNKESNKAFVHILPLNGDPFARCIDLPVGPTTNLLRYYTIVLSPDERTLYAINSAMSNIISIDVNHPGGEVFNDQIITNSHFAPTAMIDKNAPDLYNGAVFSADQKVIYAIGTRGILALSVSNLKIQQIYADDQSFTSIALSTDGKTLYA